MAKSVIRNSEALGQIKKVSKDKNEFINQKLAEVALRSENYYQIPPIIGMVIADQYGNTILVLEYDNNKKSKYGPIKSYLSENDKSLLEIDLISMYFSSLKTFADQTNIKNLSNFQIHGSNMKFQIYFLFNKFMLVLFLNSNTELKLKEQALVIEYFKDQLTEFEYEFENFNLTYSRKIIKFVEKKGNLLLRKLNNDYLQNYYRLYSKKHELVDKIMMEIDPIIQNELEDHLKLLPHDIIKNLSKELKCKIQDKLFDVKNELFMV